MTLTAGALSSSAIKSTGATITSTAASGGTGPYTQQLYRSTTTGFTPNGGNLVAGATGLVTNDSGLTPATTYYYKMVYTDVGASNATITSSQLTVVTGAQTLSQNQFSQSPYLGMIDMRFPYDTVSVQIDSSAGSALIAGQAVKIVDSAGGVPKVIACTAATDEVFGFINFDIKSVNFPAGAMCEISQAGNFIYLYSTAAISRGVQVGIDLSTVGGVHAVATTENIVGWAYDKATNAGQLIRVKVGCPSFAFAP